MFDKYCLRIIIYVNLNVNICYFGFMFLYFVISKEYYQCKNLESFGCLLFSIIFFF